MTIETEDVVAELRNARMMVNYGYGNVQDEPDPLHEKAADLIQSLSERIDVLTAIERDAVSGLRYIVARYGRLEGVGWDRVFDAHDELFARASLTEGIAPNVRSG